MDDMRPEYDFSKMQGKKNPYIGRLEKRAKYEIWLNADDTHFERGIAHMEDGSQLPLKAWVHIATRGSDSVLLDDAEYFTFDRFPFRWFMRPGAIEIYSWDALVPSVLFHNTSDTDIRIDGICILKPGESKELMRDE